MALPLAIFNSSALLMLNLFPKRIDLVLFLRRKMLNLKKIKFNLFLIYLLESGNMYHLLKVVSHSLQPETRQLHIIKNGHNIDP